MDRVARNAAFGRWMNRLLTAAAVSRQDIADAAGPDVQTQELVEGGGVEQAPEETVFRYADVYSRLAPELAPWSFIMSLNALREDCPPEVGPYLQDAAEQWKISNQLLLGFDLAAEHLEVGDVSGHALTISNQLGHVLTGEEIERFPRLVTRLLERHKAVTLVPTSQLGNPGLGALGSGHWYKKDAAERVLGHSRTGSLRLAFDPLCGVDSLDTAVSRAMALGAESADVTVLAWAILLAAHQAAVTSRFSDDGPQILREIGGLEAPTIKGIDVDVPGVEAMEAIANKYLARWREEYVLATRKVQLKRGPGADDAPWLAAESLVPEAEHGSDPQLVDPRRGLGPNDLLFYNDEQFERLPDVLVDRGIASVTVRPNHVATGNRVAQPQTFQWVPFGSDSHLGLLLGPNRVWRPMYFYVPNDQARNQTLAQAGVGRR